MSEVSRFMEKFVEGISFDGFPDPDAPDPQAVQLAEQCVLLAQEEGISKRQLKDEYGDLNLYMHEKIVWLAHRKMEGQK